MSDPYLSMIEAFGFNFAPQGWALCAGQTLSIAQNQALFALLGTTYGGNGTTTFNLPDLRGRLALGFGQGSGQSSYALGAVGGQEAHQLLANEVPSHTHGLNATNNGQANGTNVPSGGVLMGSGYGIEANNPVENIYGNAAPTVVMAAGAVGAAGGGQPHENRMPFLTINYCIALQGIFPSRN
ncbi:MAG: tail fiber protein [Stellaceae bacterium]